MLIEVGGLLALIGQIMNTAAKIKEEYRAIIHISY